MEKVFYLGGSGNPIYDRITAKEWPHSSNNRYVRDGCYPIDWGGIVIVPNTLAPNIASRITETFLLFCAMLGCWVSLRSTQPTASDRTQAPGIQVQQFIIPHALSNFFQTTPLREF